jgi:hypothetical protein
VHTREMHKQWVHILGGALWLVVHDAAVGVQGERETAAKRRHGLVQGRENDRDATHAGALRELPCSLQQLDCCRQISLIRDNNGPL